MSLLHWEVGISSRVWLTLLAAAVLAGCGGTVEKQSTDVPAVPGDSRSADATDTGLDRQDVADLDSGTPGQDTVDSDAAGPDAVDLDASAPEVTNDADSSSSDLADGAVEPVAPGTLLWRYEHKLTVDYGPAIDSVGNLYFQGNTTVATDPDGPTLISLTPDGELRWGVRNVPGSVPAPPVTIAGKMLVVPATRSDTEELLGRVSLYSLEGDPLGQLDTDGPMGDGAAWTAQGLVVAPARSVFAFDGEVPAWDKPFALIGKGLTGTNVAVSPQGILYVGCRGEDKNLYAINQADGAELWRRNTGDVYLSPLAVDFEGNVYAVDFGGLLSVVAPGGGELWTAKVGDGSGIALGGDGTVYLSTAVGYIEGTLLALRKGADGKAELVWERWLQHQGINTPALSDGGTVYLGDNCRRFLAVDAATGDELWSFIPPEIDPAEDICAGGWSSATIGPDGTVYASTSHPGFLHAFAGDGTGLAQDSPWPMDFHDAAHTGSLEQ